MRQDIDDDIDTDSEQEEQAKKNALGELRRGLKAYGSRGDKIFYSTSYWEELNSIRSGLGGQKTCYEV